MTTLNLMTAFGDAMVDPNTDSRMLLEPTPMGPMHRPLAHSTVWDIVQTQIHNIGMEIKQAQHALNKTGDRYFGMVEVGNGSDYFSDLIAFRSTHDQRFPVTISGGSGVWVCSNLCIGGSHVVKTKHTLNIMDRLPTVVAEGLTMAVEANALQRESFESYRMTQMSRKTSNAAMTEMVRRNVIAGNQLSKVIAEYDEPTHEEHAEDGNSVWKLFNSVTQSYKPEQNSRSNLGVLHDKSPRLMELCDEICAAA